MEGEWDLPFQEQPKERLDQAKGKLPRSCPALSDLEVWEREKPAASVSVIVMLLS